MVLDPNRLALPGFQDDFEIAQIVIPLVQVGFRRRDAAHAADEIEQALIMQVRIFVVVIVDRAVHQYDRGRIGHAVIGRFVALRAPFVGTVGHDLDGILGDADVDFLDFIDIGKEWPHFRRRLGDRL
jgi:hypothetical protein